MMKLTNTSLGGLCAALLLTTGAVQAAETVTYWAQIKGSKITVAGDSSLHAWTVEANLIGGTMKLSSDFPLDGKSSEVKVVPEVNVRIPVRNMKSGKEGMDNVMMQAMNQGQHKYITYKLTKLTPKAGKPMEYDSTGDLTVNGVTKSVSMPVKLEPLDGGKSVKVSGEIAMKMTDFKITPPRPKIALGLLTVDDNIKLTFEWMTTQK